LVPADDDLVSFLAAPSAIRVSIETADALGRPGCRGRRPREGSVMTDIEQPVTMVAEVAPRPGATSDGWCLGLPVATAVVMAP